MDHAAYPHIMEAILAHSEPSVLRAIGCTSRHYLALTDKLLQPRTLRLSWTARKGFIPFLGRHISMLVGGPPILQDQLVLSAPGWRIHEDGIVAMSNGQAGRNRGALFRVRAVNVDLDVQMGSEWHTLAALLPNAALRVRNEPTPGGIPTWNQSPAPTLVLFYNDTYGMFKGRDVMHRYYLSNSQRRRVVMNLIGAEDGSWFSTLAHLAPFAYPSALVINFSRLDFPDLEHEQQPQVLRPAHQSRLWAILSHLSPLHRQQIVLVGFERAWAWMNASNGFRTGELVEDTDELRNCVVGWLASQGCSLRPGLRILSVDEYRAEVGEEQFAVETVSEWDGSLVAHST